MRACFVAAAALALFATLAGCDLNRKWDLDQPFAPLAVDAAELPAARAREAFVDAIEQLGGRVQAGAAQVVHLQLDAACDCSTCSDQTVAHTERWSQSTILVCPRWMVEPPDGLGDLITHELGHVLGQWGHLPCRRTMMSPDYDCRRNHTVYTDEDKAWICAGNVGGVVGGVCS